MSGRVEAPAQWLQHLADVNPQHGGGLPSWVWVLLILAGVRLVLPLVWIAWRDDRRERTDRLSQQSRGWL